MAADTYPNFAPTNSYSNRSDAPIGYRNGYEIDACVYSEPLIMWWSY